MPPHPHEHTRHANPQPPPPRSFSARSFLLGVAAVVAAQLALRLLLRLAWVRAAVEDVRERLGLEPQWEQYDDDDESSSSAGIPGGPYGWDDEVYSLTDTGSEAGGSEAPSPFPVASDAAARGPARRRERWRSTKTERMRQREQDIAARMIANDEGESVEWVNMCIRKSWRVFQRGLERWFTDLLQPVFDGLLEVREGAWRLGCACGGERWLGIPSASSSSSSGSGSRPSP
jgi:hypothetical protein